MTGLGHNNPPVFDAHSIHIEDMFSLISGTTAGGKIVSDEQEQALDDLLDDIRKARKAADTDRAAEKRPHDDAAKAVQSKWKPLLDRCDMASDEIKKLLTPWRNEKQRTKDEAARLAREEAAQRERVAREALQQSDDLEARYDAEVQLKAARKLTATANKIDRSASGLRTVWQHQIVSRQELLRHVRERYPEDLADMLNEFVRIKVNEGIRTMPGVDITPERRAA